MAAERTDELKDLRLKIRKTLEDCQDKIDTINRLLRLTTETSYSVFLAGDEACGLQDVAARLLDELKTYRFEKYGD